MSSKPESAEMQKDAMTAEVAADEMASPDDGVEFSAGAEQPSVEELMQKLETLQGRADGYLNDLMRARAEAENVRKRSARDVENAHKYGQEKFIVEMLPVKDSMDLGLAAAESATDIESLREGMALTRKAFTQALEKMGVTEVDPLGEKFNPELHQAISVQPADAEPNTVLTVVQKGYCLHDRLLRPALVIVAGSKN
ncbi:MAG: nucleotide exchange factor GrpE [Gammaproteobacteria bacterium]